jgi:hypothetical protein
VVATQRAYVDVVSSLYDKRACPEEEFEIFAPCSCDSTCFTELTRPRSGTAAGDDAPADPLGSDEEPAEPAPLVVFERAGPCEAAIEVGEL